MDVSSGTVGGHDSNSVVSVSFDIIDCQPVSDSATADCHLAPARGLFVLIGTIVISSHPLAATIISDSPRLFHACDGMPEERTTETALEPEDPFKVPKRLQSHPELERRGIQLSDFIRPVSVLNILSIYLYLMYPLFSVGSPVPVIQDISAMGR